jgi:hypothetical protein
VINRFATDPPPQEPASSLLPFCLSWVYANGDRHLCNTFARRDCEAQGTSYWYVFIVSEQSGIPFRLRLTLLSCQRRSCSLLLCARTRATKATATSLRDSKGRTPIAKREDGRRRGARGGHRHRQQGVCPSSYILMRLPAQRFFSFAQPRSITRPVSSHWVFEKQATAKRKGLPQVSIPFFSPIHISLWAYTNT